MTFGELLVLEVELNMPAGETRALTAVIHLPKSDGGSGLVSVLDVLNVTSNDSRLKNSFDWLATTDRQVVIGFRRVLFLKGVLFCLTEL